MYQTNILVVDVLKQNYTMKMKFTTKHVIYGVVSESSRTVIVATALVKEEGRPKSHFRKPVASVCHVTAHYEHALFLHRCFFDFMFHFVCDGLQNGATFLHQLLKP
jgi:hypothetical protein